MNAASWPARPAWFRLLDERRTPLQQPTRSGNRALNGSRLPRSRRPGDSRWLPRARVLHGRDEGNAEVIRHTSIGRSGIVTIDDVLPGVRLSHGRPHSVLRRRRRQSMRKRWSIVVGAVVFAVGAIGMAGLWVKRRQLASAAAKAEAEAASAAVPEQASATADAIPEQAPAAK